MAAHNELGKWGEDLAAAYLQQKGYTIVERDWRSGRRDLDIIALDGDELVFVEVKTRRNRVFGQPEEAVGYQKLRNLQQAMNHYIHYRRIDRPVRLDVVTVVGRPGMGQPEIDHIQDFSVY